MTNYAVLIGNNEFPNEPSLSKLTCPPADVEGMKAVLTAENRGLFSAENVAVLINKTNSEISEELEKLFNEVTKNDLVLVYYSGHGLQDNQGKLHLSTVDTKEKVLKSTTLPFHKIYNEFIKETGCDKIIIILDCCFSGLAGSVIKSNVKSNISSQLQSLNNQATGTFLITATSEIETALDVNEGSRFSLFTKYLIAGLETDEADIDGDGFISIDELFNYVSKKLRAEKSGQAPRKFGEQSGELFIAKSGRDSKKERAEKIEHYFYDLAKQKRIARDILLAVLDLLEKHQTQFSPLEKQQYDLVVSIFERKIEAVEFIRKWDRLLLEVEKEQEKLAEEKAAIEKKLAEEKAAREKVEQKTRDMKENTFVNHRQALPIGTKLHEFEILNVLGSGGFSIVYLAKDTNLGENIVIKEYFPNQCAVRESDRTVKAKSINDEEDFEWGLERFLAEAQVLATFRTHPNIVSVLRYFKANHTGYMVMECIKGESLGSYLERNEVLSEEQIHALIFPLLDVLHTVHQTAMLHRDLKPDNIMINDEGQPVLIDFGTARHAIGAKSTNITAIISPGYSPFEQYTTNARQGPWTDIYALGGVMYRCVTGQKPTDAIARKDNDDYTSVKQKVSTKYTYSVALLNAIDWALKLNAVDRPQSIQEWETVLNKSGKQIKSFKEKIARMLG